MYSTRNKPDADGTVVLSTTILDFMTQRGRIVATTHGWGGVVGVLTTGTLPIGVYEIHTGDGMPVGGAAVDRHGMWRLWGRSDHHG